MSLFDEQPPLINSKVLRKWLKSNYSIFNTNDIKLKSLNSERDRNFLIQGVGGKYYVVKISHPSESLNQLNYQDDLIRHLRSDRKLSKIYPKLYHKSILFFNDLKQRKCAVRVLTYIEGKMYAKSKITDEIEISLGKALALQTNQLKTFMHKEAIRTFIWNPENIKWINDYLYLFKGEKKRIIHNAIIHNEHFVQNNKKNLKYSVTHGDPNDYNIVVN